MKINNCLLYLITILLCAFNGTLYTPGGIIAQGLQYLLIIMSLYYAIYANNKYNLPVYFKGLNILLILFTIYGMILVISGEELMVKVSYRVSANTGYLKSIYWSLLPVYPFYVFAKQGLLKEITVKTWFFVFLALAVRSFFRYQESALNEAIAIGSSAVEFTNNVGYTFVAILPALVLFHNKPIVQYICLAFCAYFIFISMKRGAILSGVLCMVWFMITNMKKVQKKRKWVVLIITILVVIAGVYLYNYLIYSSDYFRYRVSQSQSGESSGRNDLYAHFYNFFIHQDNPFRFMFGNGANATLRVGDNFAHNDWLEIAVNQGLFGLVIYLAYWICFLLTWRKNKKHSQAFMAIGMIFIIYFIITFFSMSYNSVSCCSSMVLGYYLAIAECEEVIPYKSSKILTNESRSLSY